MRGLRARRLRLWPLSPADRGFYCSLYTDPQLMRHVAAPLARDAADRAFTAVLRQVAAAPPQAWYWRLALRAGGEDIGLMACVPDRDDAGTAEVGVLLVGPATCRGFAGEAITALAEAFFAAGGQRLWTRHARTNGPAAGLMRKLGFIPAPAPGDGETLRWELPRAAWVARPPRAFASPGPSC